MFKNSRRRVVKLRAAERPIRGTAVSSPPGVSLAYTRLKFIILLILFMYSFYNTKGKLLELVR
jgi:hypothetical protein